MVEDTLSTLQKSWVGGRVRTGDLDSVLVSSFCIYLGASLLSQFPHHCSMNREGLDLEATDFKPSDITLLIDYHGFILVLL